MPDDSTTTGESESTGIEAGPECGNGVLEGEEECDDGNLVNDDGCSKLCELEFCGDGVVQGSEGCDLGPENADDANCTIECVKNVCGDGLQSPSESCDDGNINDDDGCGSDCTLESCGNAEVEGPEACDDGNGDEDDGCTSLCAAPVCGDGLVSASEGEDCDDGNPDNDDACPNDCTAAVCGDGIVEGGEACDEGEANGDGVSLCSPACTLNVCGDGYRVPELEACDEGAATGDGTSLCSAECTLNLCGDAYHHAPSEGCDEGDRNGYVPCSTSCEVVPEVVEIRMNFFSSCARYADGSVRCWGLPTLGALAIEPPPSEFIGDDPGEMPPPFASLGGPVTDIGAGEVEAMCAIRVTGEVVCWGDGRAPYWVDDEFGIQDYGGLLGPLPAAHISAWDLTDYLVGDIPGELPPTPIPLGALAIDLAGAGTSACIVDEDQALRCWGRADDDVWPALGYGETSVRATPDDFPPPPVNLGADAVDVAHSNFRTCVLCTDERVRCFGNSGFGSLGLAGTGPLASGTEIEPPPITELGGPVAQISGGNSAGGLCALGTDGSVRCFGAIRVAGYGVDFDYVGDEPGEMPPPPLDVGPDPIVQVALSANQICALSTLGDVRCWGGNPTTYGYGTDELVGDEPGEMPPPVVSLSRPAIELFGGASDSFCALLDDHSVECWGLVSGLESGVTSERIGDDPGEMPPPPMRLYE